MTGTSKRLQTSWLTLLVVVVSIATATAVPAAAAGSTAAIDAPDVSESATGTETITVTATDDSDNAVEGETISVEANDDGLSGISVGDTADTDGNGEATFTFEEDSPGTYTIEFSATDDSITDTATVTVEERYTLDTSSGSADTGLSGSVVVDDQLTIGGPSDNIAAARVTVQNKQSGDHLSATDEHGITTDYNSDTGVLSLSGTASPSQYQEVLRSVKFENTNSDASTDTTDREVSISLGNSVPSEDTGHYYEYVASSASWTDARGAANSSEYFGLQGYLVVVTSQAENDFVESKLDGNGWMGASDAATESEWRWVTGPEGQEENGDGRHFFDQTGADSSSPNFDSVYNSNSPGGGDAVGNNYENWADKEPNDWGSSGEDYAHFYSDEGDWNDFPKDSSVAGYVIEYGGRDTDPSIDIRGTRTVTLSDQTPPTYDGASRVDDTTIDVTVGDNIGIDESSIDASDFSLSDGSISSISISESGSDAVVTLNINAPVDTDTVDISIADSIDDTSGNSLTDGTATATDMDGVAPTISSFDVSNPSGQDIEVSFDSSEPLSSIEATISTAESATLTANDFSGNAKGDGSYTYLATYSGSSSGTYDVTLNTASDDAGNDGADAQSDSVDMDTIAPTADAGSDTAGDEDTPISFDGSASFDDETSITTYEWDWTDDGSYDSTGATPSHAYADPGTYTVRLRVTDEGGNTDTDTVRVDVADTTDPTADAGSDQIVAEDTSATFDGTASTDNGVIDSYEWDFDDGATATGATPSHSYADPGTYTAELTVTDGAGNTDADTLTVTVEATHSGSSGGGSSSSVRSDADEADPSSGVTGQVSADGSVEFSVSDPDGTDEIELSFTEVGDESESEGGDTDSAGDTGQPDGASGGTTERNVEVDSISIRPTETGSREFDVSVRQWDAPDVGDEADSGTDDGAPTDPQAFREETGASAIGYVEVTHSNTNEDIGEVTFRFRVRSSYLDERDTDPEDIALYRHEPDGWNRLTASSVETTDTHDIFETDSPGLSVFVVGDDTPSAESDYETETDEPDETDSETDDGTDGGSDPGRTDDQPGFGFLAGLLALIAMGLLGGRRTR